MTVTRKLEPILIISIEIIHRRNNKNMESNKTDEDNQSYNTFLIIIYLSKHKQVYEKLFEFLIVKNSNIVNIECVRESMML